MTSSTAPSTPRPEPRSTASGHDADHDDRARGGRDQDFLAPAARLRGAGIGGLEELTDLQRSERLARMRDGELGSIHSWELVTAVDGPGTRMTVFLNGCPLRCLYCHNPDTFLMKDGGACGDL